VSGWNLKHLGQIISTTMDSRNNRMDEHPEDEDEKPLHNDVGGAANHTAMLTSLQQQQHGATTNTTTTPPPPPPPPLTTATSSLASKPHAFHGSVLSPDHARSITCELVLQLSSALSNQATQAANTRGVLPPGIGGGSSSSLEESNASQRVNIFKGSDVLDTILGWMMDPNASSSSSVGGGISGGGSGAGGTGSGPTSNLIYGTPGTPKPYNHHAIPAQVLQLLRQGSAGSASVGGGAIPSTPKTSSYTPTSTSSSSPILYTPNPTIDGVGGVATQHPANINPLSLLSTAEALDSFASFRTHYTVWITEAWNILKWSEPSAALFWEMATMFHTLFVASLSVRGGGSGGEVRNRVLFGNTGILNSDASDGPFGAAVKSFSMSNNNNTATNQRGSFISTSSSSYIPPLLSCGSQSSMGSVRSSVADPYGSDQQPRGSGSSSGSGTATTKDILSQGLHPSSSSSPNHHHHTSRNVSGGGGGGGSGGMKPARHSARELPVWLISMFLLVHCEHDAVSRCTSGGDDDRRFSDHEIATGGEMMMVDGSGGSSLDFTALLHHKSLSPRTRLHATGTHQNNANCASFLLRHLRKFLLLCAVPRNAQACRALTSLATGGGTSDIGESIHRLRGANNNLDVSDIEERHRREHGNIGLNVELTIEELDRLHLVLQSPSGGIANEPPIAIGEHILKCLAMEELEVHRKSKPSTTSTTPVSRRWQMMQNGLVTVADAERILRRYLEEEITAANNAELDANSDEITSKLSKVSLGAGGGDVTMASSSQPVSPSRSRGASDSPDAVVGSYLKELSYKKLRSTTVLLESVRETSPSGNNDGTSSSVASLDQHSQASSTTAQQVNAAATSAPQQQQQQHPMSMATNESGRLHDLHIADCSDTFFYLLQPFEHATIAACTDCTIVVGAVAGLLHVVDCERTTITSAARRVVVSNSGDVVHYIFTPSPPLLVGDNRGCQFAPYNTYYDGLREDLLATGLAAVLRSASGNDSLNGSVAGDVAASPGRGGEVAGRGTITSTLHTLQCASNKWKVPVGECACLEA
jgi:hypothetical protein